MRMTIWAGTRWAAAGGFMLLLAAGPGGAGAGVFNPETFTLANGLEVVVVPNHRIPVVTQMVWYKVGSADEEPGKSGVAHFLEHLMFKGTTRFAPGEFSRILARNGARENAFTADDYTGFHQTIAADRLELVMDMEADRMTNVVFNAKEVEPERQVVLEERRSRVDNNPASVLREHVNAALYMNYPYRTPIIGWEHEIRAISVDDLRAFYRRWYAPNNAILVVAGDITVERLRPLVEKYYGPIPRAEVPVRRRPSEPPQQAARRVVLKDARVGQPSWSRTFLAPSYTNGATADAYPLQVLAEAVGGSASSPLYRALVIDGQLAVSAGVSYDPNALGPGTVTFYATPRPGVTMERIEAAMDGEIERLLREGVGADEVARAKQRLVDQTTFARDSLGTGARWLGAALAIGRTVADVEEWPERIASVTAEEVRAVARAVIREGRSVTAELRAKESG